MGVTGSLRLTNQKARFREVSLDDALIVRQQYKKKLKRMGELFGA